jgi:methyl-accepting chemotaxis protein
MVNATLGQLDEITQQNAALVEQAAAAAESMYDQAQKLALAVAVFTVDEAIAVPPLAIIKNHTNQVANAHALTSSGKPRKKQGDQALALIVNA